MSQSLQNRPFIWPVRVYYEDTDAAGVIYHTRYLHYTERARTEWLRTVGIDQSVLAENEGVRFVVTHMEVDFKAPGLLDNLLLVETQLVEQRRASMQMHQRVMKISGYSSHHLPNDDEAQKMLKSARLLVDTQVTIATINARGRPTRIPKSVLKSMGITSE